VVLARVHINPYLGQKSGTKSGFVWKRARTPETRFFCARDPQPVDSIGFRLGVGVHYGVPMTFSMLHARRAVFLLCLEAFYFMFSNIPGDAVPVPQHLVRSTMHETTRICANMTVNLSSISHRNALLSKFRMRCKYKVLLSWCEFLFGIHCMTYGTHRSGRIHRCRCRASPSSAAASYTEGPHDAAAPAVVPQHMRCCSIIPPL
jgi:hypothetical protein